MVPPSPPDSLPFSLLPSSLSFFLSMFFFHFISLYAGLLTDPPTTWVVMGSPGALGAPQG